MALLWVGSLPWSASGVWQPMQTLSAQCHKAAEMMAKSTAEQDNESETTAERDIDSDFLSQSSYVDEDDDAGDAEIDDEITAITASMVHCNHHHHGDAAVADPESRSAASSCDDRSARKRALNGNSDEHRRWTCWRQSSVSQSSESSEVAKVGEHAQQARRTTH